MEEDHILPSGKQLRGQLENYSLMMFLLKNGGVNNIHVTVYQRLSKTGCQIISSGHKQFTTWFSKVISSGCKMTMTQARLVGEPGSGRRGVQVRDGLPSEEEVSMFRIFAYGAFDWNHSLLKMCSNVLKGLRKTRKTINKNHQKGSRFMLPQKVSETQNQKMNRAAFQVVAALTSAGKRRQKANDQLEAGLKARKTNRGFNRTC